MALRIKRKENRVVQKLQLSAGLSVAALVLVCAGLGLDEWAKPYVHASPEFDPWLTAASAFLLLAILLTGSQIALILYVVHQIAARARNRTTMFIMAVAACALGALCGLFYAIPVFTFPADLSDSRRSMSLVISSAFFMMASAVPLGWAAFTMSKPNSLPGREYAYNEFLADPSNGSTGEPSGTPLRKGSAALREMEMSSAGPGTPDIPTSTHGPATNMCDSSGSDSGDLILQMEDLLSPSTKGHNRRTSDELLELASNASPNRATDIQGDSDDDLDRSVSVPVGLSLEKSTGKSKMPPLYKGVSEEAYPPWSENGLSKEQMAQQGALVTTRSYPSYDPQPSCLPPMMRKKNKKDKHHGLSSLAPRAGQEPRNSHRFSDSEEHMGRKSNGRVARFKQSLDRFANLVTDQPPVASANKAPGRVPSYYLQGKGRTGMPP